MIIREAFNIKYNVDQSIQLNIFILILSFVAKYQFSFMNKQQTENHLYLCFIILFINLLEVPSRLNIFVQVECRGCVGETVFHVCFLMGTPVSLILDLCLDIKSIF